MMTATLKVTHKAIGVEVRRGTYDILVDGECLGTVKMNHTTAIPIEPGHHTLQVRDGRKSSQLCTFDVVNGQAITYRCTGKSALPVFLASFVIRSVALQLRRVG
jgi:hypothetical protein